MNEFGSVTYVTILMLACVSFVDCVKSYERSFNKSGSRIVFPDSVENEIQEVPLDLVRRINDVSSMDEFLKTMLQDTESEFLGIAERIGSDDIERNAVKSAKRAKCMPELTTISLQPVKMPGVIYYPPCTRVQRCGGCCVHDLLSCQPEKTEIIQMKVVVTEFRGGRQLHFRENKLVEVEQHTSCKCDCKIRPEDCNKFQKYSSEKCLCECANTDKEKKCYKEGTKKIWNPDTCTCDCREEIECSSGFNFDPFICDCVPARQRNRPSFIYEII